ncbi:hypothetical protein IV102_28130 [bacterium]|nr:hypothetical protein [bacterium]
MQVDQQALQSISQRHSLGFLALFGSSTRGKPGRDMDIAVMPLNPLENLRDQEQLFALVPDWMDRDVATELARLARLRNMLIHQYEDILPAQVYQASLRAAPLWRTYLERISEKLP